MRGKGEGDAKQGFSYGGDSDDDQYVLGSVPVLESLCEADPGSVTFLCAEWGMGKTCLLRRAMQQYETTGYQVLYRDLSGMSPEHAARSMRELLKRVRRSKNSNRGCVVALDNIPAGDEAENDIYEDCMRQMGLLGAIVFAALLPEGAPLVEQMPGCRRYWSCDLVLIAPGSRGRDASHEVTHGIASLYEALPKLYPHNTTTVFSEPAFQEAFVEYVSMSVRGHMYSEERRIKLAMLLMGHATKDELDGVAGPFDEDLWRTTARDAPLFGIDLARRTFACVGSSSPDAVKVASTTLRKLSEEDSRLVSMVAEFLAVRGDLARAAAVACVCSDEARRAGMVLAWAGELVDAGAADVVADAVYAVREGGLPAPRGFKEACVLLAAAQPRTVRDSTAEAAHALSRHSRAGRIAVLAQWCLDLMRGRGLDSVPDVDAGDTATAGRLLLHGQVVTLLVQGRLSEAYGKLAGLPLCDGTQTLSGALLFTDYLLCTLLLGAVLSPADQTSLDEVRRFLGESGFFDVQSLLEAVLAAGKLLAGRTGADEAFETHMRRAERMRLELLRGLYMLVAAVSDVRAGIQLRAHVRLGYASASFEKLHCDALAKQANILDVCVRAQMGEKADRRQLLACKDISPEHNHVISALLVALSLDSSVRGVGAGRWGERSCPTDVYWMVNVIAHDFGALSTSFYSAMPPAWRESVALRLHESEAFFEKVGVSEPPEDLTAPPAKGKPPRDTAEESEDSNPWLVEVSLLGGFEVRVCGKPVSPRRLERRRAKALLALLATVPGHSAKRFAIMDSIWPELDYRSAGKCVYAATSVLRTELQVPDGEGGPVEVLIPNKNEGTLRLNPQVVHVDADEFEAKARRLLDTEGDAASVVALSREADRLYRGDLFVTPLDAVGICATRAVVLRRLYTDAMVAGSLAAIDEGMQLFGCRLASKAHESDDLREDAMEALMMALCAAGRRVEAERSYDAFVGHLVDTSRRTPSRRLRRIAQELLKDTVHERTRHSLDRTEEVRRLPPAAEESGQLRLDLEKGLDP